MTRASLLDINDVCDKFVNVKGVWYNDKHMF